MKWAKETDISEGFIRTVENVLVPTLGGVSRLRHKASQLLEEPCEDRVGSDKFWFNEADNHAILVMPFQLQSVIEYEYLSEYSQIKVNSEVLQKKKKQR